MQICYIIVEIVVVRQHVMTRALFLFQEIPKKKNIHLHYFVNKYTKFDPTIPRINYMSCVSRECKSNTDEKIEKDILYIKYDRENLKYLYMCCLCDTIWDNNMNAIKFDVD